MIWAQAWDGSVFGVHSLQIYVLVGTIVPEKKARKARRKVPRSREQRRGRQASARSRGSRSQEAADPRSCQTVREPQAPWRPVQEPGIWADSSFGRRVRLGQDKQEIKFKPGKSKHHFLAQSPG